MRLSEWMRLANNLDAQIEKLKDRMESYDRSMEQLKDRQDAALSQEGMSDQRKEALRTSFERRLEAIQRDKNEVITEFQKLMAEKCSQPKGQ